MYLHDRPLLRTAAVVSYQYNTITKAGESVSVSIVIPNYFLWTSIQTHFSKRLFSTHWERLMNRIGLQELVKLHGLHTVCHPAGSWKQRCLWSMNCTSGDKDTLLDSLVINCVTLLLFKWKSMKVNYLGRIIQKNINKSFKSCLTSAPLHACCK